MAVQKEFRIPGSMIVTGTANVGSLNILSGDLNITGGVTTTANVSVGGATLSTKNIYSNGTLTLITGATSAAPTFTGSAGNSNFYILTSAAAGNYNALTSANDTVLVSTFNAADTGNLVLGVWSSRAAGLGIKVRAATADIVVSADSIKFGNTGISANGTVGTNGQILYSNGTSSYWAAPAAVGVTSVATSNGIQGGTITSTGTLYAVGANGISVTSAGINVLAGNSQLVSNSSGVYVVQTQIDHNSLANYVASRHADHASISISAGNGLTGGGTIDASRTLAVTAGNSQVVANSSGVFINQTQIDHNSLANYSAARHIDHSTINIAAGTGLTGGGTIDNSRTLTLDTVYVQGLTVNGANYLGGQPGSYYTDIPSRLGFTPIQQGGGTGQGTNKLYIGWLGSQLGVQVDSTNYGASWPINVTGSAGSVAWTNVSGRPTALSQFSNDSGFITSAGRAYPRLVGGGDINFNWSGQSGQPSWVWGGSDGTNMYVYNPSNFSVNYASSAGAVTGVTLQGNLGTSGSPTFAGLSIANDAGGGFGATWNMTNNAAGATNKVKNFRIGSTGTYEIINNAYSAVIFAVTDGGFMTSASGANINGSTYTDSLGVGTAASGTSGEIRATNEITAYYSDARLKTVHSKIDSALDKVNSLSGVYYNANETAAIYGYDTEKRQVGVIAQEVAAVLPEVTALAPFDTTFVNGIEQSISGENYLTVHYEKLVPLLIEAIKELSKEVNELKAKA